MPVFSRIHGIVLESGGLISHGAIIAREFGLPGAQLPSARKHIPDGATITLDGDTGIIQIHDESSEKDQDSGPADADSDHAESSEPASV
jgi:pyruvate,water dikinase